MSGLQGKRVLITRARQQAPALAKLLEKQGAETISIPSIEIVPPQSFQPLDKALRKIQSYEWLILTSVNGVSALRKRMDKVEVDAGLLKHLRICAIGPATKQEIETQLGLKVEVVPEEYVAESVVASLKNKVAGKHVLLVRARVARDVIPKELRAAGAEVDIAEAYETVTPVNSAKKLAEALSGAQRPDAITFTSSSTARNFTALLPKSVSPRDLLTGVAVASIGPVTSKTLREVGLWVDVEAQEYTMEGLVAALDKHFSAS
jgi:uroporphyrinogen-III synthase